MKSELFANTYEAHPYEFDNYVKSVKEKNKNIIIVQGEDEGGDFKAIYDKKEEENLGKYYIHDNEFITDIPKADFFLGTKYSKPGKLKEGNSLYSFADFINEKNSGELFNLKRNKYVNIDPEDLDKISDEVIDLINTAYKPIGGHSKLKTAKDVENAKGITYWKGVDLHGTRDFDLIMFGKHTKHGIKFSGVGHDGEKDSKREYIKDRARTLKLPGYYIEVSGKIAEILMGSYKVPVISDEEIVKKVLKKDIEWVGEIEGTPGNGWYKRKIGKDYHTKILIGNPKI